MQGMQSARGAVILFADADGATKFSDLIKLESGLKDIVKGNDKLGISSAVVYQGISYVIEKFNGDCVLSGEV
jgi:hypothetical protein